MAALLNACKLVNKNPQDLVVVINGMATDPAILAMTSAVPKIMPAKVRGAGAAVVVTGRRDPPNQVNNLLAFSQIFRGALNAKTKRITESMKIAAVHALAFVVKDVSQDKTLPAPLDKTTAQVVARAMEERV